MRSTLRWTTASAILSLLSGAVLTATPVQAAGALPDPPSAVTSSEYPNDQEFHGEAGRTGFFTIHAPIVDPASVTSYLVAMDTCNQPTCATEVPAVGDDHHATIAMTPTGGPQDLFVWSKNSTGISLALLDYQFLVRRGSGPAANWLMDEGTGSTLSDASGHGNTATLGGPPAWTSGPVGYSAAVTLNGGVHQATTIGPITRPNPDSGVAEAVRTDTSFSVAAWVRLTDADASHAAVSVDGTHNSGFVLGYSTNDNRWALTVFGADSDGAPVIRALSAEAPQLGVWTHLTGTFDLATGQLALYVDGRLEGQATNPTPWNAAGQVRMGAALRAGQVVQHWHGDVDEVQISGRLLFSGEIAAIATAPKLAGQWPLEAGAGTVAADTSGIVPAHPGTLVGGTSWTAIRPEDARPFDGGLPGGAFAVAFDGATGAIITTGPVVRTDRSFSVTAWVRLTDAGADHVAVAEEGRLAIGLVLGYDGTTGSWTLSATSADASSPTPIRVIGSSGASVGTWTHLAGVYDSITRQLRLYVDGTLDGATSYSPTWNAAGPLLLGRAQVAGAPAAWWAGDLADVHVYAGVLSEQLIADLAGV